MIELKDIYRLDIAPISYNGYDTCDIDDDVLEVLERNEADAGFYWYGTGSYEGSGELIILKNNKWYLNSLSHCSCYGPLDHLNDNEIKEGFNSLHELTEYCTDEYNTRIISLIQLIKDKGYGPQELPDEINIGVL